MVRNCDHCGGPYEAKRASSRYCSGPCRVKASRKRGAVAPAPRAEEPKPVGGVRAATLAELERAGRVESAAGQSALALADLLDNPPPMTWSSVAGWAREHRASLAEAVRGVKPAEARSTLDEIKARRDAKRRGA